MTTELTTAQARLLAEIADRPIPFAGHDQRRPFRALSALGLVRHNARRLSDGEQVWALTAAGRVRVAPVGETA